MSTHSHTGEESGPFHAAETADRPTGPYVAVNADPIVIREALGGFCFAPNWHGSTRFRGENVNLARQSYHENPDYPDLVWWQVHVRGWQRDDGGCYLRAHFEPSPAHHTMAHAQAAGYDVSVGMNALRSALADGGIPVEATYTALADL